jgi:parvulin-like peptidyl-prolyl isomerase
MRYAARDLYAQDKIIAVVNSDVITQKDLNDFINFTRMQLAAEYSGKELESKIQAMKLDLLDKLIEDRLILQEAKKEKVLINEERVKAKIDEIKGQYQSESAFQADLAKQGVSQADIENKIREQLLMYAVIDSKVRSKLRLTPKEITDFYKEHAGEFQLSEQREFIYLSTKSKDLANEIYGHLKSSPQDFEQSAEKYSLVINKISAKNSGELRKDIEDAVFKLRPNEVTPPLEIENSYYICRLDRIIPARKQSLSEIQASIYAFLYGQKMQEELSKWLDEIKKNAYIKIL